jgi:hypothetical protein
LLTTADVAFLPLLYRDQDPNRDPPTSARLVTYGAALVTTAVPLTIAMMAATDPVGVSHWDTTLPRAVHLGLWTGLDLFVVRSALNARSTETTILAPDATAFVLGGFGALVGGWYGATQVKQGTDRERWMMVTAYVTAPLTVIPVLCDAFLEGLPGNGEAFARHARWEMIGAMTLGVGLGYVGMATSSNEPDAPRVSVMPVRGGMTAQWGGVF